MRLSRMAFAAVALVSMILTAAGFAPAAAAEPQYVTENSVSYDYELPLGQPSEFCTGRAFIGQTSTNRIEASSESSCTGLMIFNSTETFIRPGPNTLESLADNGASCHGDPLDPCTSVTAATSVDGGPPGTLYCVRGFGNASTGEDHIGSGAACITTK